MMFKQTKEILGELLMTHKQIIDYYNKLADRAENERVKILLSKMKENKEKIYQVIEKYQQEGDYPELDEWIQFTPQKSFGQELEDFKPGNNMTMDEVTKIAAYFDNRIENILKHLEEKALSEDAKEIFSNISEMINRDKLDLSSDKELMKDL